MVVTPTVPRYRPPDPDEEDVPFDWLCDACDIEWPGPHGSKEQRLACPVCGTECYAEGSPERLTAICNLLETNNHEEYKRVIRDATMWRHDRWCATYCVAEWLCRDCFRGVTEEDENCRRCGLNLRVAGTWSCNDLATVTVVGVDRYPMFLCSRHWARAAELHQGAAVVLELPPEQGPLEPKHWRMAKSG
jgi:hypothetical protein